jgi:hypothetical protein
MGGCIKSKNLCQKLLRPDQPIPDHYSVGALNDARRAIAATHLTDFPRQFHETQARLIEAVTEVVVSQKTQLVCNRHTPRTLALALVTHAAVIEAVLFITHIQSFSSAGEYDPVIARTFISSSLTLP